MHSWLCPSHFVNIKDEHYRKSGPYVLSCRYIKSYNCWIKPIDNSCCLIWCFSTQFNELRSITFHLHKVKQYMPRLDNIFHIYYVMQHRTTFQGRQFNGRFWKLDYLDSVTNITFPMQLKPHISSQYPPIYTVRTLHKWQKLLGFRHNVLLTRKRVDMKRHSHLSSSSWLAFYLRIDFYSSITSHRYCGNKLTYNHREHNFYGDTSFVLLVKTLRNAVLYGKERGYWPNKTFML